MKPPAVGRYAKVHLPDEPGFHEPCHYEPGDAAAEPIDAFESVLADARRRYPGYLRTNAPLYADAWRLAGR